MEAIWALSSREGAAACARLWARDDAGGTTTKRETTTTPRIVLTHKNENLYNAYACEMAAVTRPAARAMEVGMFAAANGGDGTTRACAGTRAEIMPLACAASAEELLETVEGMRVRVETRAVAFYHDCVARNARRMSSDEVSRRFRGVVARWSARGLDDSRDERSNAMRFAVVEGLGGVRVRSGDVRAVAVEPERARGGLGEKATAFQRGDARGNRARVRQRRLSARPARVRRSKR